MLNKELLIGSPSKKYMDVLLTVKYSAPNFGFKYKGPNESEHELFYMGKINVLPYWNVESDRVYMVTLVEDAIYGEGFIRIEPNKASLTLTVTTPKGATTFDLIDQQYKYIPNSAMRLSEQVDTQILLTFDPPPRWVLGSKDTRTNLRRGYYVEGKVPWEAQNAEQGASYGCR